jgi:hypothetical protein
VFSETLKACQEKLKACQVENVQQKLVLTSYRLRMQKHNDEIKRNAMARRITSKKIIEQLKSAHTMNGSASITE